MSLLGAWRDRFGHAEQRLLRLDDVRFCSRLDLEGFEHLHAVQGQPFDARIAPGEGAAIAERAARLYLGEARAIHVGSGAGERQGPCLVVRATPTAGGRYRVEITGEA